MNDMIAFNTWYLQNMPSFLLSDPVKYLFGLVILAYCLKILFNLKKGV